MMTHLLAAVVAAQFAAIEGQVLDARTRVGITLATVELQLSQVPVDLRYTNAEGRFRVASLGYGRYTLKVTYPGYESAVIDLEPPVDGLPISVELTRRKTQALDVEPVISIREYLVPEKVRKEFESARREVRRQNCPKAVDHFEKGLLSFDADAAAHNDLGNCYRQLNQLDRAEASFRRALALSDSVYVALNLSEVHAVQGRYGEAEAVLSAAIRKTPNAGDGYYGLALLYLAQGMWEEAETSARQADLRPHQIADVHLILASLYSKQGKSDEGALQLELYLKEAPNGALKEQVRRALRERRK
jgi:tetratricopeptide (TPR) repeat protein